MNPSKSPLFSALIAGLACYLIPFGQWVVYPFTLFVTLVHEGGHVLMALLTRSEVMSMAIAPDGSGLTLTAPSGYFASLLIANAGYLSATGYGAVVLRLADGRGDCRGILRFSAWLVAGLVVFFTLFVHDWFASIWTTGLSIGVGMKLFTILAGFLIAYAFWRIAQSTSKDTVAFVTNFLGVECIFNGLGDIKTVLALSLYSNAHSDARNLAELTGVPSVVWALGWAAVSVLVIISTFKAVLGGRGPRPR